MTAKILTPDEARRIHTPPATPATMTAAFAHALIEGGWRNGCQLVSHEASKDGSKGILLVEGKRKIRVLIEYVD